MKAMGIYRGPKKAKTMHVPNLYPFKKRMIENIENKKKTVARQKLLDKMALKTKAHSNLSVVKEDPQVREAKYLKEQEMAQDSKKNATTYLEFLFSKPELITDFFREGQIQKAVHEGVQRSD